MELLSLSISFDNWQEIIWTLIDISVKIQDKISINNIQGR